MCTCASASTESQSHHSRSSSNGKAESRRAIDRTSAIVHRGSQSQRHRSSQCNSGGSRCITRDCATYSGRCPRRHRSQPTPPCSLRLFRLRCKPASPPSSSIATASSRDHASQAGYRFHLRHIPTLIDLPHGSHPRHARPGQAKGPIRVAEALRLQIYLQAR